MISELPESRQAPFAPFERPRKVDLGMLAGIAIAVIATVAGVASTGVSLRYFLQPTGALIVLGGTLGVTIITTPHAGLLSAARRVRELFRTSVLNREELIDEIVSLSRVSRSKGLFAIEPLIEQASNKFLADSLLLAMDVRQRSELQSALQDKVRLRERQGEVDARILEVAGGFAPTIGVVGTVVGLIDVFRQFSTLSTVVNGVGTAFVSTIYGLVLANVVLLPAAQRIRARVAEAFETHELMMEGVLCVFDGAHPAVIRQRLNCFLRHAGETHDS